MRTITIDNGNSNPHVGIFVDDKLNNVIPLSHFTPQSDDFIIASNVGKPLSFKVSYDLSQHRPVKNNSHYFDMPVHYSETLGDDRLITAYGVFQKIKSQSDKILVIDAGTFITLDLVTSNGFEGGFIFPGLKTFLNSYQQGAQLPTLEWNSQLHLNELPHSTEQAILGALELYLSSIFSEIIKKTSPSKIVLTGGSAEKLAQYFLKTNLGFQFDLDLHLIHLAMLSIIQSHLHR